MVKKVLLFIVAMNVFSYLGKIHNWSAWYHSSEGGLICCMVLYPLGIALVIWLLQANVKFPFIFWK